jgi:hypothetical protein
MTSEQEKCAAEAYRRWREIEPLLPREEVERRVRKALDATKDDGLRSLKIYTIAALAHVSGDLAFPVFLFHVISVRGDPRSDAISRA